MTGSDPESTPGDPEPKDWPVLVTGASGFVGGHVARTFAEAGHRVRGLSRRPPLSDEDAPTIEWIAGDLRDPEARRRALRGVRAVVHAAAWVSLGPDRLGEASAVNLEATRALLADCRALGVERLIYTSTLHTMASGTAEEPASEETPWNLDRVDSPYARSKRAAERIVLDSGGGALETVALCPGMVIGGGAPRPTSTRLLIALARARVAILAGGGIPILDAQVAAEGHRRALTLGESGRRYALVGPYLSYPEQAKLVASIVGRPRRVIVLPDPLAGPAIAGATLLASILGRRYPDLAPATVAGGFLRLHVRGDRADRLFGLRHPPPIDSFRAALDDARCRGYL